MTRSEGCRLAWLALGMLTAVPLAQARARSPNSAPAEQAVLKAADATVVLEPATGFATSIRVGQDQEEMCQTHPAGSDRPFAFVEVEDLRSKRVYSPLHAASSVSGWKLTGRDAGAALSFTQQYQDAPFRMAHLLQATPAGIRWQATISLLPGQRETRSLRVSWVLPLPWGWCFWGPNDTTAHTTDGVTGFRYVYGHTDYAPYATVIPLVGVWGESGGAAVFSPPDVRKVQVTFDVPGSLLADPPKGVRRRVEDLQALRVSHHMIGLGPGRELTLAVCLAGTRADWRGVMGHYVRAYPELFEPVPAARKHEGMYGGIQAGRIRPGTVERLSSRRVTCLEVHGHFPEYGTYILPEALDKPDLTWRCRPHPSGELSLAGNRALVDQLLEAGVSPFMYFYNVHATPSTVEARFKQDLTVGEDGRTNIQYQGEPALRAQPDSPFGRNLLEQMDLLLRAYPKAPGFFVDNFSIQWADFAHDDGLTMVHDRPAYDMNRNHQDVGTACFRKAHQAGKVIMVNKLATIESARGVDMVLLEDMSLDSLKVHALACAFRAVFPTGSRGREPLERTMQHLLVWGGTPADVLEEYRPLTDALIGKRWVFDPDPLELPPGYQGQIFRVDPSAPHGGDVVVTIVNPSRSRRDLQWTEGLSVLIRLPEGDQLRQATWLPAEKSKQDPQPCRLERTEGQLEVRLPPVGAAGILRLKRGS